MKLYCRFSLDRGIDKFIFLRGEEIITMIDDIIVGMGLESTKLEFCTVGLDTLLLGLILRAVLTCKHASLYEKFSVALTFSANFAFFLVGAATIVCSMAM